MSSDTVRLERSRPFPYDHPSLTPTGEVQTDKARHRKVGRRVDAPRADAGRARIRLTFQIVLTGKTNPAARLLSTRGQRLSSRQLLEIECRRLEASPGLNVDNLLSANDSFVAVNDDVQNRLPEGSFVRPPWLEWIP